MLKKIKMDIIIKAMKDLPKPGYLAGASCNFCNKSIFGGKFMHNDDDIDMCEDCMKINDIEKLEKSGMKKFRECKMHPNCRDAVIVSLAALFEVLIIKCDDEEMKSRNIRKNEKGNVVIEFVCHDMKKLSDTVMCKLFSAQDLDTLIAYGKIGSDIEYQDDETEKIKNNKTFMDVLDDPENQLFPEEVYWRLMKMIENFIPSITNNEAVEIEKKVNTISKALDDITLNTNRDTHAKIIEIKPEIHDKLIERGKFEITRRKIKDIMYDKIGKDVIRKMSIQHVFTLEGGKFEIGKDGINIVIEKDLCAQSLIRLFNQIKWKDRFL